MLLHHTCCNIAQRDRNKQDVTTCSRHTSYQIQPGKDKELPNSLQKTHNRLAQYQVMNITTFLFVNQILSKSRVHCDIWWKLPSCLFGSFACSFFALHARLNMIKLLMFSCTKSFCIILPLIGFFTTYIWLKRTFTCLPSMCLSESAYTIWAWNRQVVISDIIHVCAVLPVTS